MTNLNVIRPYVASHNRNSQQGIWVIQKPFSKVRFNRTRCHTTTYSAGEIGNSTRYLRIHISHNLILPCRRRSRGANNFSRIAYTYGNFSILGRIISHRLKIYFHFALAVEKKSIANSALFRNK